MRFLELGKCFLRIEWDVAERSALGGRGYLGQTTALSKALS